MHLGSGTIFSFGVNDIQYSNITTWAFSKSPFKESVGIGKIVKTVLFFYITYYNKTEETSLFCDNGYTNNIQTGKHKYAMNDFIVYYCKLGISDYVYP